VADDVLEGRLDDVYVPLELLTPEEVADDVRFPVCVEDLVNILDPVGVIVPLTDRELVFVDCIEGADLPVLVIETVPVDVKDRAELPVIVLLEVDVLLDVLLDVIVTVFMGVFVSREENVEVIVRFIVNVISAVELIVFVGIDERDNVDDAVDVLVLDTEAVSVEDAVVVLELRGVAVVVILLICVFVPFDVLLRVGLDVVVLEAAAERVKEGDAEAVRVEPIVLVPDDVEDVVFDLAGVDEEVLLEVVVLEDDVDAERVFVVIVLRVLREEEVDVLLTSPESVPFCVDTIVLLGKEV